MAMARSGKERNAGKKSGKKRKEHARERLEKDAPTMSLSKN